MHHLWAAVHRYKPSMNYFPVSDRKNSLNGSKSTFSRMYLMMWEVVALALKKPAIAPPGKKQRDYREEGREREKTVCSRSQFERHQGHFLFSQHETSLLNQTQSSRWKRERERDGCLPAMWVFDAHLSLQGWSQTENKTSVWEFWSTLKGTSGIFTAGSHFM